MRPLLAPRHECHDCQGPIVFLRLDTGSVIPLDPMPNQRGNVDAMRIGQQLHGHVISAAKPHEDRYTRMIPHAATCPERKGPAPAQPTPDLPLF